MLFRTLAEVGKESGVRVRFVEEKLPNRLVTEKGIDVLHIAVGEKEKRSRFKMMMLARTVVAVANRYEVEKLIVFLKDFTSLVDGADANDFLELFAMNADMANYRYVRYKEMPKDGWKRVHEIVFVTGSAGRTKFDETLKRVRVVADAVSKSRDLANTPGGHMTPELLAHAAKKMATGLPIRVKILKDKEMKRLGMGGVLGVAQGSKARPRFIVMEYLGSKNEKEKPLVFVGKGVTFDSGGIDIKPSPYGLEMKLDMSGGAVVAASLCALARLKVKKNIVALIPAVENMPSGESYRPGDVLRSLSGKTIEVLNTDAEGRIILADAFAYAQKFYKPKAVVDVATLTGASLVALGRRASAIFSPDEETLVAARACGEETGDRMWPLPLWEEFEGDIAGDLGDVANMASKGDPRDGGTIIAAVFLWQFAKEFPKWLHIDMAPRMTPVHDELLEKGSAGSVVRFLVKFGEKYL